MATLSVSNLEQFNQQDKPSTTVPRIKRKQSIASRSRRSSHSSSTGAGVDRWRRLSRGYSISMLGGAYRNLRSAAQGKPSGATYENSYRMQPEAAAGKFNPGPVEGVIAAVLEANLRGARYEPRTCAVFAQRISEEIKQRVKDFQLPRYKLVAHVSIGANQSQGVQIASRAVWDTGSDSFATACYRNKTLFAVGSVHAVYFE